MNKRLVLGVVLLGFLSAGSAFGEGFYLVFSPDGKIKAKVTMDDSLTYSVWCDDKAIIVDSPLRLEFEDGALPGKVPTVRHHRRGTRNEKWKSIYGQHSEIADNYNELWLAFHESAPLERQLRVAFRAYNDGVAFRYFLPKQEPDKFVLTKEDSQFRFAKDHTVWAADYKKFVSHQEEEFKKAKLSSIKPESVIGVPLLVQVDDSLYVAITEANLTDWAGMYLCGAKSDGGKGVGLTTKLSPRPDGKGLVKGSRPHYSPWRVIIIGRRPGDLIE